MRRSLLRCAAAASVATAVGLMALPVPGGAAEPIAVGWWQRDLPFQEDGGGGAADAGLLGQTLPPPTVPQTPIPPPQLPPAPGNTPTPPVNPPPPANVPEGGLYVANDASGAAGVSALRFDGDGVGAASLELDFATGTTFAGPVDACPVLVEWTPEANGEWHNRPADDCNRVSVAGVLRSDGTGMEWSLPASFKPEGADVFDIVLLPPGSEGAAYQVVFEPPSGGAFTVLSAEPPPSTTTTLPLPPDDELPPPLEDLPGFQSSGGGAGGTYGAGSNGGTDTITLAAGGDNSLPGPLETVAEILDNPTVRRVAAGLLLAIGGFLYWMSGQPARAPRVLGALAGNPLTRPLATAATPVDRPRGLGRFTRPRSQPPRGLV